MMRKMVNALSKSLTRGLRNMSLKKLALTTALMLSCAAAVSAQESKCSLKVAELPSVTELRGFRLGMTIEQVQARLPKAQLRPAGEFGFTSLNIFPNYEPGIDKTAFEGVRTISLEFLDGRVTSLWIGYDKSFKWQTLDEFMSGMTTALKLPNAWRTKFRTRLLECADFTVSVIPVGEGPSIKLTDEAARELLEKRKAAKEESRP
jgi:hypothetical protein